MQGLYACQEQPPKGGRSGPFVFSLQGQHTLYCPASNLLKTQQRGSRGKRSPGASFSLGSNMRLCSDPLWVIWVLARRGCRHKGSLHNRMLEPREKLAPGDRFPRLPRCCVFKTQLFLAIQSQNQANMPHHQEDKSRAALVWRLNNADGAGLGALGRAGPLAFRHAGRAALKAAAGSLQAFWPGT